MQNVIQDERAEERTYLFARKFAPRNSEKWISYTEKGKLLVNTLSRAMQKYLMDNKHSLYLVRIFARMFVIWQYLFLEAHSFPWTSLSLNFFPLRTNNV